VKVVANKNQEALYFSRSAIPYFRNLEPSEWVTHHTYFKHIGMYGYRTDVLNKITQLDISSLEKTESLEQLRWLENGYRIKVKETTIETIGIDTPDDLAKAIAYLKSTK
jgi:3-deoxy-manno-octulosonate cytidylyltransferase (CMP-KDO synthetase)